MTDGQLASGMRQLKGAFCTMRHQREVAEEAVRRGLMRFHEWPSGHWAFTERGRDWLSALDDKA